MTRCLVSAIVLALIAAHVAAAEEDLAAQIKAAQKERVKVLTELAEIRTAQYKVEVIPCEFLVGAEVDLLNAQLDATDKREERIAVLEEGAKRRAELLKTVEGRLKAETTTEADVYRARSLLLDAKVRLLRERGPNDRAAGQIKAMQKERIEVLSKAVEVCTAQFKVGTIPYEFLVGAEADLVNAQLDAMDKREGRIAVLEVGAKRGAELFTTAVGRLKAATITDAAVYRIESLYWDTKVRLLRERGPNDRAAGQIKAMQKERIEASAKVVKLVEDQYRLDATGIDAVVSAECALVNAQVNAADTAEAKILVLTNAAKKGSDSRSDRAWSNGH